MNKPVITGMGVVSPLGNTVPELWDALCAGRSGIRPVSFEGDAGYSKIAGQAQDVTPAGMGPKEIRRQSRFILFAVEASDQAIRQAGFDMNKEDPRRCAVVVGSGIGGVIDIHDNSVIMHTSGPRRVSPLFITRALANIAPGQVAIRHGFQGANRCVVTACASGTQALGEAADLIRCGRADVVLAGGAEATVFPFGMAGFAAIRALSARNDEPERASRPFDRDRDGFVMGEGAGMLLIESEAHAKARGAEILAEVAGMGESCDAYHVTAPLPDGSGPARSMQEALNQAQLNPEEVQYCNAHGTSTSLNDAGESRALRTVFGETGPIVSSTKSMIGHLLGAAGAVEAVACVMSLRTGIVHPSINYDTPDPECPVNLAANTAREMQVNAAISNSLGFGGHNASIIFRRQS